MIFWWFQRYNEMNSIQQLMAVSNCRAQRARDIILRCCKITTTFDIHVTVHRDKFLIIKPTRCTNFSNLFLGWNFTCFGQFFCPSSGAFHCTHSNGIYHTSLLTYTIAACTVKNSWWWTGELSETCRVLFQEEIWEISASSGFYYKKSFGFFKVDKTTGLDCIPNTVLKHLSKRENSLHHESI